MKIESEISRINQTDFDITKSYSLKKEGTTVKNLIGYEWKDASNGATIEVVNPATQELIDTVPNVTEQDVEEAAKVAEKQHKKAHFVTCADYVTMSDGTGIVHMKELKNYINL